MFKVTSFNQGFCCSYSHYFVNSTTFFRYMNRYSCTCLSSNLPIINGLHKETLGISMTSSDKCTLVREDSYFLQNNLTVLSETWNFHTALAFSKIEACLLTSSLSLSANWLYFLFLGRGFSVSVTLSWSIAPTDTSSTLGTFASLINFRWRMYISDY